MKNKQQQGNLASEATSLASKVAAKAVTMALNGVGRRQRRAMAGVSPGIHLANRLKKIIGSGDYEVADDVARNPVITGKIDPTMSFGHGEGIVVKNREMLGDVVTSSVAGQFNVQEYLLNPADVSTFPVLSAQAQCYEEYVIHGLIFEIVPTSSNYSAAGALGATVVAYSANPSAPTFFNKTQMENSANAVSARFDKGIVYGVECAHGSATQNSYMVDAISVGAPLPVTATTMGKVSVATAPASTYATSSPVGELHVTYVVEFRKPRAPPGRFGYTHIRRSGQNTGNPLGTIERATTVAYGAAEAVTCTPSVFSLGKTVPGDTWLVTVAWFGTAGATTAPTVVWTGGTTQAVWGLGPSSDANGGLGTTASSVTLTWLVTATSASSQPTFATFTGGTYPTPATALDIIAVCVGSGIATSNL